MRLSLSSPFPPSKSGIADYSAALLDALSPRVSVTPVRDPSQQSSLRQADLAIYQIGNNEAHDFVYRAALEHPGLVVLHEANLHHLIAEITIKRGDWDAYMEEVAFDGGPRALAYAQAVRRLEVGPDYDGVPMLRRVLGRCRGLLVHSEFVAGIARQQGYAGPIAVVPHGAWIPDIDASRFRSTLGLDDQTLLIGVFGHIKPYKRIRETIRAFRRLLREHPHARLVLVGQEHPDLPLEPLLSSFDLQPFVRHVGFAPIEDFVGYMAACDIIVNLRYPTVGETSGSLLRAFGLGKPALVSEVGAFAEFPDNVCLKVPVGGSSEEEILLAYLRYLATHPAEASAIGANARQWVDEHCNWNRVAEGYIDFCRQLLEDPQPAPMSPPVERGAHRLSSAGGHLSSAGGHLAAASRETIASSPTAEVIPNLPLPAPGSEIRPEAPVAELATMDVPGPEAVVEKRPQESNPEAPASREPGDCEAGASGDHDVERDESTLAAAKENGPSQVAEASGTLLSGDLVSSAAAGSAPNPADHPLAQEMLAWAPNEEARGYLMQHISRLIQTLELLPDAQPGQRILEMGCYLQITPLLSSRKHYTEIRGCYYGKLGGVNKQSVQTRDGRSFSCLVDEFDAEHDRYPYPDQQFDAVLCTELFEHLGYDPMHCLAEINRILKPGGCLLLSTPNVCSRRAIAAILGGYHPGFFPAFMQPRTEGRVDPRHHREYAPREMKQAFEDAGFRVDALLAGDYWSKPEPEHAWIDHLLERYELDQQLRGECLFVLGRKEGPVRDRYPGWLYYR
jgi:glycosyltransferase involved in cell wall biosynthesis/SAM-dependent methyltransferase